MMIDLDLDLLCLRALQHKRISFRKDIRQIVKIT